MPNNLYASPLIFRSIRVETKSLWLRAVGFLIIYHSLSYQPFTIGKDATEAFEDVGHSDEARDILKGLFVGDFEGAPVRTVLGHLGRISLWGLLISSFQHPKSTPPQAANLHNPIRAGKSEL